MSFKPEEHSKDSPPLSPWWMRTIGIIMVLGFAVLLAITYLGYRNAPPIPGKVTGSDGQVLFTKADVGAGQSVFLKHGLMNNGSIWGHGAYLGPDFSADALHKIGMDSADILAQQQLNQPFDQLDKIQQASITAQVAVTLKTNRYDPETDILTLTPAETLALKKQPGYWKEYFSNPANSAGLKAGSLSDPEELRQFSAFVAWTAWASVAERPGYGHSYTNNFPYDPLVGNHPTAGTTFWSAMSLIVLLGGIAFMLLLSGRFEDIGWISAGPGTQPFAPAGESTSAQRALVKFSVLVTALFLFQTLVGGAVAHYRIEPDGFYGIPLEKIFPSNLLRTWHLQSALMWIATSYVAAALFLGSTLRRNVPEALAGWAHFLFAAFVIVIVGSLLSIWLGISQLLGDWWFWIGNQGWEYLELGRAWQYLLAIGLLVWFGVLWWLARPAKVDKTEARPIVRMFMVAALAIPVFYLPALFYGAETNFTIVDTWRFWIIHLWVEGFFEFFATTVVALILYQLGLARRNTALGVIYLDAILYFLGGLIGTGHHWYFSGHSSFNLAAAALVSVLEVVPLTLLTLDAWRFIQTARGGEGADGKRVRIPHKWTIYFLIAVGFWNFFGAGVFGFLINLPIVSYYEVGTQITPTHGHAALMGVFGMLGLAVTVFTLRQTASDEDWPGIEKYVRIAYWGTNAGLLMMVLMSLFPSGALQMWDVMQNGYWHARSQAYIHKDLSLIIEWLRLPGDLVFIIFGSIPITIAAVRGWQGVRRRA
ncbi:nitric-oxide reductase large subunit [Nitrosomonas sp. HPC101]|uniref:nitric-oxide reductase large subunit n=1 Tax=Nitrosomonas sp. HPC101 TaxID=1658667 RepID=UPI00136C74DA|nr:cbb3-type cytochrome c oxidase subunit I [Nitrosomonas sp. HPC101]MXS86506.1 nitric-oxide reductase large subunit [Nitrosomonas sp. HPC101]